MNENLLYYVGFLYVLQGPSMTKTATFQEII